MNGPLALAAAIFALALFADTARAQDPGSGPDSLRPDGGAARHMPVPEIEPLPEDVSSLDGIVRAYYDVISGPAGEPRQWARDRTLYVPGLRFVSLVPADGPGVVATVMDHQDFVDRHDAGMVRDGFYEREIHRVVREFGNMAQVFSTYEMRVRPDGPLIGRGVNSLLVFDDGRRWWIAGAVWQGESAEHPIPRELLPE